MSKSVTLSRAKYIKHLREFYKYDATTGDLISTSDNKPIGVSNSMGVKIASVFGEQNTVARLVWMYHYGRAPSGRVMQMLTENGTKIENLYETKGNKLQGANAPTPSQTTNRPTSGEKGVTWQASHGTWRVVVKRVYLGNFKDVDKAIKAKWAYLDALEKNLQGNHPNWYERNGVSQPTTLPVQRFTEPTKKLLEHEFTYDEETGKLYRNDLKKSGKEYTLSEGERLEVGTPTTSGYLKTTLYGKSYQVHRLVWCMHYGYLPETPIYHKNRNPRDNRIENLTDKKLASLGSYA
jgi:hypothetical protein